MHSWSRAIARTKRRVASFFRSDANISVAAGTQRFRDRGFEVYWEELRLKNPNLIPATTIKMDVIEFQRQLRAAYNRSQDDAHKELVRMRAAIPEIKDLLC